MPLTCSVGLSKKIGLPDYGSLGASCNVTFELDATLLQHDLDAFQQHARNAYLACRQAVNDELARNQPATEQRQAASATPNATSDTRSDRSGNGQRNGNGATGHRASQKQRDYIEQLARQIRGLGVRRLEALAEKMFGRPMAELTSLDASGLIDTLKAIKDGSINLDDALNGAAT